MRADSSATPGADTPLMPLTRQTGDSCRRNFTTFAVLFAVNHAAVAVSLVYATSVLDSGVGYYGTSVLYISTLVVSLFFAAPIVQTLGSKRALVLAMTLYCVYAGAFILAMMVVQEMQLYVYMLGSLVGGFGAAILWTSQGTYFTEATKQMVRSGPCDDDLSICTADNGSHFAFYFLLFEIVCRLGVAGLQRLEFPDPAVFGVCFASAACATVTSAVVLQSMEDPHPADDPKAGTLDQVGAVILDARIWCLAFTNFTFGLSSAYMNGYVNAYVASPQLGESSVGVLTALTSVAAVGFAVLGGHLAAHAGQGTVILLGALSMLAIPLCALQFQIQSWRWFISLLFVFQGVGRATYEGINRAVFAQFFSENAEGAFAVCTAQASFAFAVGFFIEGSIQEKTVAVMVLVCAAVTYPCYLLATQMESQTTESKQQNIRVGTGLP